MNKQELLEKYKKRITIENYSNQTIKSYLSAVKLFLEFIEKLKVAQIGEDEIENYLYFCKEDKKYSFSAMKLTIASIHYLYSKVLLKPVPQKLFIKLRKPSTLPTVFTLKEISRILEITRNLKHKTILFINLLRRFKIG